MKELQKVLGSVRRAVEHYDMIADGDKIAVGLSGGKDSAALLLALAKMREFYPKKYEICGITVEIGFEGHADMTPVREFCEGIDVEYRTVKTQISKIVFEERNEKNPCSLCAKMRRGALVGEAEAVGANKIALGHHMNDAVETFMIKLMYEGKIGCFSPVTFYEDRLLSVIRPLIYTREGEIRSLARAYTLPVVTNPCPKDHNTEREKMKKYLMSFEQLHHGIYEKMLGAMERSGIDDWH